jgi:DNA-binding transcriptional ArsR family regulator
MHPEIVRRVVLDASSLELRRRLGPTAWVVFEELRLASAGPTDACEAEVSVRTLAARLGLAKDTIARALTRLRNAGLVSVSQSRATTGVFATGSYQLHVSDAVTVSDHTTTPTPTALRSRARRSTTRSSGPTTQLSLAIEP